MVSDPGAEFTVTGVGIPGSPDFFGPFGFDMSVDAQPGEIIQILMKPGGDLNFGGVIPEFGLNLADLDWIEPGPGEIIGVNLLFDPIGV